jgi:D-alanyl-D-alanine carboxypeptidase
MTLVVRRLLLCLVSLAVLALSAASASPSEIGYGTAAERAIVDAAKRELAAYGGRHPVPAVLIGVWSPAKSFVKGIGYGDLAARKPLSPDDKFRIGSNTKTFVISAVLQLVDERRLNLDDPLSKFHLGVHVPNENRITVRELCEMRAF